MASKTGVLRTNKLLSTEFTAEEEFLRCLTEIYEDFRQTKNPVYPRQELLVYLVNVLLRAENTNIQNTILALLTEFSCDSKRYDSGFVRKQLVALNIAQTLCQILTNISIQKNTAQVELVLCLLYSVSGSLIPSQAEFVINDIIPRCMAICDTKRNLLFTYTHQLKEKMKEMLIDKTLYMQANLYEEKACQDKCSLMSYLFGCRKIGLTYCRGQIWDTSREEETNIGMEIVNYELAWLSHESSSFSDDQATDVPLRVEATTNQEQRESKVFGLTIIPSFVVAGPHFFAHVHSICDEDGLEIESANFESEIAEVEGLLADIIDENSKLTSEPVAGDYVTVHGTVNSVWAASDQEFICYRAQVCSNLSSDRESGPWYLVVSLDYGFVDEVSMDQLYAECRQTMHIRPIAILCSIADIQPRPLSTQILRLSLAILENLSLGYFPSSMCMVGAGALGILSDLARAAPDEALCVQALNILINISHESRSQTSDMLEFGLPSIIVALLKLYSDLNWKLAALAALRLLSNLAYHNTKIHDDMISDLPEVLQCVILNAYGPEVSGRSDLYTSAVQLTSNLLEGATISEEQINKLQKEWDQAATPEERNGSSASGKTTPPSDTHNPRPASSDKEVDCAAEDVIKQTARFRRQSRECEESTDRRSPSAPRLRSLSRDRRGEATGDATNAIRDRRAEPEPVRTVTSNGVLVLSTNAMEAEPLSSSRKETIYYLNQKTGFTSSESCEVHETHANLDDRFLQRILLSFLNTGISGRLLFGLKSDGTVVGINMNRDLRDQIRLAIDRISSDFEPKPVLSSLPTLYFHPVFLTDQSGSRVPIQDRYIIEIQVEINPNLDQAYTLRNSRVVYIRVGAEAVLASAQDYRELVTRRMENALGILG